MSEHSIERSGSGSPIYRHAARGREWTPPAHPGAHSEEIAAHVERHVGKIETVFHEIASDLIHLDVLCVPATAEQPYHVLVTSGVSERPMNVPGNIGKFRRAELMIALPADWPLSQKAFNDEAHYWPVRWLKQIGRLPHEYDTWIGWGHTIPNGDPPEPIANTNFAGVMVSSPYGLPSDFHQLMIGGGDPISFYVLVPLYREEIEMKLKKGAELLQAKLEKHRINQVVDVLRKNVASRGWFGW
jgi:hypothetical protein